MIFPSPFHNLIFFPNRLDKLNKEPYTPCLLEFGCVWVSEGDGGEGLGGEVDGEGNHVMGLSLTALHTHTVQLLNI